jgi:hypothetical protein
VVQSPHRLGVDPIADELIMRFGDFSVADGGGGGSVGDGADYGVELEPSDAAVDFRDRVAAILKNNGNSFAAADNGSSSAAAVGGVVENLPQWNIPQQVNVKGGRKAMGGTLDQDLNAYFAQEDQTRRLSNLGFFERDTFMDFD